MRTSLRSLYDKILAKVPLTRRRSVRASGKYRKWMPVPMPTNDYRVHISRIYNQGKKGE